MLRYNVAESDEDFGVDRYGIVQQGAHNIFNMRDAFVVKFGDVVSIGSVLDLVAIVDLEMFVR